MAITLMDNKSKVDKLFDAYKNVRIANMQLRNHRVIANQSVPEHKQQHLDKMVTQCTVKQFNAQQAWDALQRKKYNEDETKEFQERVDAWQI